MFKSIWIFGFNPHLSQSYIVSTLTTFGEPYKNITLHPLAGKSPSVTLIKLIVRYETAIHAPRSP
jgi:hypothetical protein